MKYDEWLERYRKAWIERDADLAGSLFTEDAFIGSSRSRSRSLGATRSGSTGTQ